MAEPEPFQLEVQEPDLKRPRRTAEPAQEPAPERNPRGKGPRFRNPRGDQRPREPYDRERAMAKVRADTEAARRRRFERWGLDPDAVPCSHPVQLGPRPWQPASPEDQIRTELARRQALVAQGWTFAHGGLTPIRMEDWQRQRAEQERREAERAAQRKAEAEARRPDARTRNLQVVGRPGWRAPSAE